ncbi:MAG: Asp-tRNA(Asn)/Glu-tRNA(Gln) amidotransferase subunit GatC [Dissulfurispiraceae bacterium]
MKITSEETKHIAQLSKLSLSEEEIDIFSNQLSTIMEYMEQLNGLNTGGIDPTSHVIPLQNVMRDDELVPSLQQDDALKNAPDTSRRFYRVPRIIE